MVFWRCLVRGWMNGDYFKMLRSFCEILFVELVGGVVCLVVNDIVEYI